MTDAPPTGRAPAGPAPGRGPGPPDARAKPTTKRVVKVAVAALALAVLGFLFMRSLRDTRAEPYTVARANMQNWTLAIEPDTGPGAALLVLRPPVEMTNRLFKQLFARAMESFDSPASPAIPLVLRAEFDRALAGHVTPETLMDLARAAGLGGDAFKPHCLGYRRVSDPTASQQLYFVLFEAPAFSRFRERIAGLPPGGTTAAPFDAAALSPVLFIAAAETSFSRWLPLRADAKTDCVAPVIVSPT